LGSGPRSRSRRSASAAVRPMVAATAVSLTGETRYLRVESLDVPR
jgi:hypothetical protein